MLDTDPPIEPPSPRHSYICHASDALPGPQDFVMQAKVIEIEATECSHSLDFLPEAVTFPELTWGFDELKHSDRGGFET
jgi:hypothetical protein